MAALKIGNTFYNCSFTILAQQDVDFLFGLDMLKRFQCCINLKRNVLELTEADGIHEVPFLSEHVRQHEGHEGLISYAILHRKF